MQFTYYAKKISGEEKKGTMEAKDRFGLAQALRRQGYTLISCKEKRKARNFSFSFSIFDRVSVADKMIFSRNLSVMVSSGLPVTRALNILSRQTKNKKFEKVLLALVGSVQKGNPLSEAMKDYSGVFSSLFIAMVKVGEESGKLSESLQLIGEQLERDHTLNKKIKGALIYPSIIITAMIVIGVLMLIYIVPTLVATFEDLGTELPASTKAIILISNFFISYPILITILFLFLISTLLWFFRSERGKRALSLVLLRLPLFSSIVKKINSARTSRTLSSLISSGVNVVEALTITRDVLQNYKYKQVLDEAKVQVQKGVPMSESFKKEVNLFPILVGEMMAVGEETGTLSNMLARLADFYEGEVSEATKDMSTVIEPILMVIIGVGVGFFAISMIKPMYSMMSGL